MRTLPISRAVLATALAAAAAQALAGGSDNLIVVTTTVDSLDAFDQACSLREALLNANTNTAFSPVLNECPAGSGIATDVTELAQNTTYPLTLAGLDDESGDLDVGDDPTLPGGIADLRIRAAVFDGIPTIEQTVAGQRVLEIAGADVELVNVAVSGGEVNDVGGGIYNNGGALLLEHAGLVGNSAISGGGLYSTGPVTLVRAAMMFNEASLLGGGIFQEDAALTSTGSIFGGNTAVTGGALYGDGVALTLAGSSDGGGGFLQNSSDSHGAGIFNATGGTLNVSDTLFFENTAGGDGGGIHSASAKMTVLTDVVFTGNTAANGGGGYFHGAPNELHVDGGRFEDNSATAHGGALSGNRIFATRVDMIGNTAGQWGGAARVDITFEATESRILGNSANEGGGVRGAFVLLDRTRVEDNVAVTVGGGLVARRRVDAIDSRITGNTAGTNGGGMWLSHDAVDDGLLLRSLVAGNRADGSGGGGVFMSGEGTLTIANTTLSENRAPAGGGSGLYVDDDASVTLVNATLADNAPGENVAKYGTLTMQNSIITSPGGIDCVVALENPEIVSLGNNLSDDDTCIGLDEPTDMVDVDVLLAPIAYTSGTMLTHALLPGSPAIDRGDAATCAGDLIGSVDQRGGLRNIGTSCDIGAHEQGAIVSMTMFGDGFE